MRAIKTYSLLICTLILMSNVFYAQTIETFNKQDTLYYVFKHKKYESYTGERLFSGTTVFERTYKVSIKDEWFSFFNSTHIRKNGNWLFRPNINTTKQFLRTHKNQIFHQNFLKKLSRESLEKFYWKNRNKIIYLVDTKECGKKQIVLRRVKWSGTFFIDQ